MQNSWIVLLPPILVLILAFSTHRVIFSLLCGITTAAFILNDFSISQTINTVITRIWETSELGTLSNWQAFKNNWNLFICLFLIMLGVIIVLINHSGGAYAYGNFVKKKLKTSKNTQSASLILSLLFFIDDHFSSLTVGSVMHSLTDKFKIARAKTAFLVDSMAAPLAIIAPISSWAAYIIMQLRKSGISDTTLLGTYIDNDPFLIYIKTIPFVFYSLIMIVSVWFIVRKNISIGLMNKYEKIAQKTGNLFGGKPAVTKKIREINEKNKACASMMDFLLPIITLISTVVISILYTGDFYLFGGNNNFLEAFKASKSANSLFIGGVVCLCITLILFFAKKKVSLKELPHIFAQGYKLMGSCIIVLVLAWTFSGLLKDDLLTGQYLANLLLGHVSVKILPLLFFIVSAVTSITMGSAWGCMAVMIPIAIPMITSLLQLTIPTTIQSAPILLPTLGAILSGAVSGNHISPLSDTTIMSAASSGSYHIDHVRTQHSYAFPVLFCTGLAFAISGFLINFTSLYINFLISFAFGIACNFGYLWIRNKLENKKVS